MTSIYGRSVFVDFVETVTINIHQTELLLHSKYNLPSYSSGHLRNFGFGSQTICMFTLI